MAKIGLLRAGGHDEAVVGRHRLHAHQVRRDRLRLQIDRADLTPQHPDVLLLPQDQPGGRGDVAFGQDPCRHLIQQWLEQMGGGLRDEGDVDVGPFERLGRIQAAESASDDGDAMALGDRRGLAGWARHTSPFPGPSGSAAHVHRTTPPRRTSPFLRLGGRAADCPSPSPSRLYTIRVWGISWSRGCRARDAPATATAAIHHCRGSGGVAARRRGRRSLRLPAVRIAFSSPVALLGHSGGQ